MTSAVVTGNGIDIHYRITGDGAETLVLINGIGDDLDGWANQTDDFVRAGLRVISFDNRGVGRSSQPPGPYTSREMAADLKALVTELGLSAFHLAGVSMGGVIAQEYAVAQPADLRSLVLANTFALADPFTRAAFETWALVAQTAGMPVMMRQQAPWIYSPQFYDQHPERVAELIGAAEASTQPPAAFAAQMAALVEHDCSGRVGSVTTPTLVIAARDDIIIRPELSQRLFDALPEESRSWTLVAGGHAAFWEDPGPWNRAVIEFVRANSAG
ncbi:MAG TPA: alpha/beta hydrolase [Streptosporangiaceae bacterium]|nr:alpha/beta hydrolase [Streptosporangiaceae bacterium]